MIAFATLSCVMGVAIPLTSLSVLLPEIARDFSLGEVGIGILWAISSVMGMFIGLAAGAASDRFGTRNTLIFFCVGTAIFGALRGFVDGFWGFLIASFLLGIFQPAIPIVAHKVAGEWFGRSQLGLANGIISAGFAIGLSAGAFLAARYFSPWLGGWANVLILYGILMLLIGIGWALVHPPEENLPESNSGEITRDDAEKKPQSISLRQGLAHVARLRDLRILAIGTLFLSAGFSGFTGYLPTYLQNIGWDPGQAGSALSVFFLLSLAGVIPISMLSDRLQKRRVFLLVPTLIMAIGFGMLSIASGPLIWLAIAIAGFTFDGYMSITQTTTIEVEGIGMRYAGTALGFVSLIRSIGGIFSPPIGNGLSFFGPSVPFAFWGIMALIAMFVFWRLPTDSK